MTAQPDLVATGAAVSGTLFGYTIGNSGTDTAGPSTTGIYLSSDATIDGSDTLLTTVSTPSLSVGDMNAQSVSLLSLAFPGSLTPGTYYLGAIADYNGQISEASESNNASNAVAFILGNDSDNTLNAAPGGSLVMGLGGNDTIHGSANNDTIIDGAGNDTIRPDAGNDIVSAGGGNDLIIDYNYLNAADQIDGGAGTDTVYLTGDYTGANAVTFNATTMVNVEALTLAGGFSYTLTTDDATVAAGQTLTVLAASLGAGDVLNFNGGAETDGRFVIEGGAGNDVLTGGTGNDKIDGGAGNDTISPGAGNDTVNAGDGNDAIFAYGFLNAADKIDGGAGNDTVYLNGDYTGANSLTFNATTMTNVETLSLAAGHSYTLTANNATVAAGQTLTVDGSALGAGDVLNFNGSLETDGNFSITGGAGADLIQGGAGNDTITSGAGNDTIRPNAGNDIVSAGDGNDTIFLYGFLTAADRIDGGTGADSVYLSGNYAGANAVVFNATTMTNVETMSLAGGFSYTLTTNDATVAAGQTLTVYSSLGAGDVLTFDGSAETDGNFVIDGGAGNDVLTGGAGNDKLLGGAGNDTISPGAGNDAVSAGAGDDTIFMHNFLNAADSIDGGAGNDTVYLDGDYTGAHSVTFGPATMTNVETLSLAAGHSYDLTTSFTTAVAGQTMTVDGSALGAGDSLTFGAGGGNWNDPSMIGNYNITGGAGNDTLQGPPGGFAYGIIDGGAGNDHINGSGTLYGGAGNDFIVAATGPHIPTTTVYPGPGFDTVTCQGNGNVSIIMYGYFDARDTIEGGGGYTGSTHTTVYLSGDYTGANAVVFGPSTILRTDVLSLAGGNSYSLTTNDTTVAAGKTMTVDASSLGTGDVLTFNASAETNGTYVMVGGAGNDVLTSGAGNDTITGGHGNDTLTGGAGNDTFIFHAGDGNDTITDFVAGSGSGDVISLNGYGITTFAALQADMAQVGSDTVITFDANDHITLHNVTMGNLNSGDFLFS